MEKKIIYVGKSVKEPWGNLRYQHGTPEEPNAFNLPKINYTILQDVRRGNIYDYEVRIEPGTYYVSPFTLSSIHGARVTYCPYGDGEVIISGGRCISGFRECEVNGVRALCTEIEAVKNGEWSFDELYVNKTPRKRPTYPKNGGKLRITGVPGHTEDNCAGVDFFTVEKGVFDGLRNVEDITVEIIHYWLLERFPVASYDAETQTVRCKTTSCMTLKDDVAGGFAKYRITNVYEYLSDPGEWYLDRKTGILYYIPLPGETVDNILVEAPVHDSLMSVVGTPTEPAENIVFRNLIFENVKHSPYKGITGKPRAAFGQAAGNCDGAIKLRHASHVDFEGCTIRNMGNYGIELGVGCTYDTIIDCEITGCGAGGIRMTSKEIFINAATKIAEEKGRETGHNRIENNHIHHCTQIDYAAIGIWIAHGASNRIAHNEIHDMKYSGISVGWIWGMLPSPSENNIIEYNHIYRCGDGDMSDMGGIYLLGPQGGTEVRGNYVHDIRRANYGGWGIYLDEGSSHVVVEKNVCYDCDTSGIFTHYGRENVIRYNIFGNGDAVVGFGAGVEVNFGNYMKNLFYTDNDTVYFGDYNFDFKEKWLVSDCNFIYTKNNAPLKNLRYGPRYESFDEWQSLGLDVFSKICKNAGTRPTKAPEELLPFGFPSDVDASLAGRTK